MRSLWLPVVPALVLAAGGAVAEPVTLPGWTVDGSGSPPSPPSWGYSQPVGPPPGTIPLQLRSTEPGAIIELYSPGTDVPIAECEATCLVYVLPGTYRVTIGETEDTVGGSRELSFTSPTLLEVDPDTREHRSVGLGLGIAGPIAMVLGVGVLLGGLDERPLRSGDGSVTRSNDGAIAAGALLLLGGLTATPIGWVMFGTSMKPEYEEMPLVPVATARARLARASARSRGPLWSAGLWPFGSGAGLRASVLF